MHPNSAPRPYPRLEQVLPPRAGTLAPDRSFLLLLLPSFFTSNLVYFICRCLVVPPLPRSPLTSAVLSFPPFLGFFYFTLFRFLIFVRVAQRD